MKRKLENSQIYENTLDLSQKAKKRYKYMKIKQHSPGKPVGQRSNQKGN